MSKEAALAWLESFELARAGVQAKRFSLVSLLVLLAVRLTAPGVPGVWYLGIAQFPVYTSWI